MSDPFERAVQREEFLRRRGRHRGVWKRFGVHLRTYLIVNVLLAVVWAVEALLDNGHPLWFVPIALGWGIGLLIHYVVAGQITREWWPRRDFSSSSGIGGSKAAP